jgi:multidrug efflux pump subunit AcrA (membrane-fusion protein)
MNTADESSPDNTQGTVDPRRERVGERRNGRALKIIAVVLGLVVAAGIGYGLWGPSNDDDSESGPTAVVKRGNLTVSVTEGGGLFAMESLEMKSEVEGENTIVEIVDEGAEITEQDVEQGKVMVELDSSDLEERESDQEISFYNAESGYTQARENFAIQQKQNESNIAIAKLNVKFARMELERYLGADLAAHVLDEGFDSVDFGQLAQVEVQRILSEAESAEEASVVEGASSPSEGSCGLGGTARQRLRDMAAQVQLAEEELTRAQGEREWSEQLSEKEFISRNELLRDQLEEQRRQVALDAAKEGLRLFKRYTLPKEAEQRYSDHIEQKRDLERVEARARSQLAQTEAALKSTEATYELQKERLDKVRDMLEKCTIRAVEPGRVVYASSSRRHRWRGRDHIREGIDVHQNQLIILIPDLSTLAARVSIHESDVRKLKTGQRAIVSVEALAGRSFEGVVRKISPVATAPDGWLNEAMRIYETDVALVGAREGLTPGMSATAEIVVAELKDALYVPIEAVTRYRGKRVCLVRMRGGHQVRRIETGLSTDKFVEIKDGLDEGQVVFLHPADLLGGEAWAREEQPELRRPPASASAGKEHEPTQELDKQEGSGEEAPTEDKQPLLEEQPMDEPSSEYMTNGQVDWQKISQEMEGLSPEEKRKKWEEIVAKLPDEQRKQLEEWGSKWQQGHSAEGRQGG